MNNEFLSLLINGNASVKEAIKLLDKNDEKILFVVDDENRLIGSLTDGDVRRWILKEGSLKENVSKACFGGTYWAGQNADINLIKEEIQKMGIEFVPILDENKRIIDFLIWEKLFDGKVKRTTIEKLEIPVIIMAGGKGTRLDPFTKVLPKPLIPIGDKTILEIIFDKFTEYQVDHFYLSINHKAKIIKSYFEELQPEYSITYLYEYKPLGTVGAIKQLEGQFEGDFLLTNCDIIIDTNYTDLLKFHRENKNDITLVATLKHYNIPYGICEIENGGTLVNIKEKPEFDFLINTGMYLISADLIKFIPLNEFFHITDLMKVVQKSGKKVGVYPISENSWTDIGEWIEYKKAVEKLRL